MYTIFVLFTVNGAFYYKSVVVMETRGQRNWLLNAGNHAYNHAINDGSNHIDGARDCAKKLPVRSIPRNTIYVHTY